MKAIFRKARIATSVLAAAAAVGLLTAPAAQAAPAGVANPDFEVGASGWNTFSVPFGTDLINNSSAHPAHSGAWKAELGGHGRAGMDRISQQVTVPAFRVPVLTFWLRIDAPTPATFGYHELTVEATAPDGTPYTLVTRTNKDSSGAYEKVTVTLPSAFYSSTEQHTVLSFFSVDDSANRVPFLIDDVSMAYQIKIYRPIFPPFAKL
ncbi:hypothetical protein BX265_3191 [Streptomyces sp. TLI_235]|nr:hypothetical protein [Streptomyces sp. TLI_235]PBC78424.1 hypothetical protein BX265_3191 [Streptomyces sp. TLI_235]